MPDGFVVLRYVLPLLLLVLFLVGASRSFIGQSPVAFAAAFVLIGGLGAIVFALEPKIRAVAAELAARPSVPNDNYWLGVVVGLSIGYVLWSRWRADRPPSSASTCAPSTFASRSTCSSVHPDEPPSRAAR